MNVFPPSLSPPSSSFRSLAAFPPTVNLPPSRRSARFALLPTAAHRNSPAWPRHRCSSDPFLASRFVVSCARRIGRLRRVGGATIRFLSLASNVDRSDAESRACVEWRQRRQARPPEPPSFGAADGSAAHRRLPSVSGKMGAPRRAVA